MIKPLHKDKFFLFMHCISIPVNFLFTSFTHLKYKNTVSIFKSFSPPLIRLQKRKKADSIQHFQSDSGLARIELATRSFGDSRSTTELQPYNYCPGSEGIEPPTAVPKTDVLPLHQPPIICQSNKPGSVLRYYLSKIIYNDHLHFQVELDKLAQATVYHSSAYQTDWA